MTYAAKERYVGQIADNYLDTRQSNWQWRKEQAIAFRLLKELAPGSTILDAPIGTGRFLPIYLSGGYRVIGIDISPDMLAHAAAQVNSTHDVHLFQQPIEEMTLGNGTVNHVVCFRFANWISTEHLGRVLQEFKRVTRETIILYVRVCDAPSLRTQLRRIAKPRTFVRIGLALIRRFRERNEQGATLATSGYHIHDDNTLRDIFEQLELAITKKIVVEQGEMGEKGVRNPLVIYVLESPSSKN